MTEILLEQTLGISNNNSTMSDSSAPYSFLGRLLSTKSSKLSGINGSIYSQMCQQLEPEKDNGLPAESWNASVDPMSQRSRYRSDSELSTVSKQSLESPTFDVPKWSWPEIHRAVTPTRRISEPLKPAV